MPGNRAKLSEREIFPTEKRTESDFPVWFSYAFFSSAKLMKTKRNTRTFRLHLAEVHIFRGSIAKANAIYNVPF